MIEITAQHATILDWVLAFSGILLYQLMKIQAVPYSELSWDAWLDENLIAVILVVACTIVCLLFIPHVYADFDRLDSLMIGMNAPWIIKAWLKQKENKFLNSQR